MTDGWIKLHRSLLEWEWIDEPNTLLVWLVILLSVNHEKKNWHGIVVNPGEMVTSYAKLAEKCHMSVRSVRTAIKHLKVTHEVTCTATKHYTIISVVKWADYQYWDGASDTQSDTPSDNQVTNKRQTSDKQVTTNKKEKNEKKEKNIYRNILKMEHPSYIQQQIDGTLPSETPASDEEIEAIKRLQEKMT